MHHFIRHTSLPCCVFTHDLFVSVAASLNTKHNARNILEPVWARICDCACRCVEEMFSSCCRILKMWLVKLQHIISTVMIVNWALWEWYQSGSPNVYALILGHSHAFNCQTLEWFECLCMQGCPPQPLTVWNRGNMVWHPFPKWEISVSGVSQGWMEDEARLSPRRADFA